MNDACVVVAGAGANLCEDDQDCLRPEHKACVGLACQTVTGGGADLCEDATDCANPTPTPVPEVTEKELPQAGGVIPTATLLSVGSVLLLLGMLSLLAL